VFGIVVSRSVCFFVLSSAFLSGLQETDCILYTYPLSIPSSHISAEAALVTQKAYAVVALRMLQRKYFASRGCCYALEVTNHIVSCWMIPPLAGS
jgi:hypothetical protein